MTPEYLAWRQWGPTAGGRRIRNEYCTVLIVTLGKSETYKETIKEKSNEETIKENEYCTRTSTAWRDCAREFIRHKLNTYGS